jgi:hypothetical protein
LVTRVSNAFVKLICYRFAIEYLAVMKLGGVRAWRKENPFIAIVLHNHEDINSELELLYEELQKATTRKLELELRRSAGVTWSNWSYLEQLELPGVT